MLGNDDPLYEILGTEPIEHHQGTPYKRFASFGVGLPFIQALNTLEQEVPSTNEVVSRLLPCTGITGDVLERDQ